VDTGGLFFVNDFILVPMAYFKNKKIGGLGFHFGRKGKSMMCGVKELNRFDDLCVPYFTLNVP
jgi:hypothetical protein